MAIIRVAGISALAMLALIARGPLNAQPPAANPADVATITAIVRSVYAMRRTADGPVEARGVNYFTLLGRHALVDQRDGVGCGAADERAA